MKKKKRKLWLRIAAAVLAVLLLVVAGYVLYVFLTYHRLPDGLQLEVRAPQERSGAENGSAGAENAGTESAGTESAETVIIPDQTAGTGVEYEIITYNVGFGAYTPDFSFFMDGGKSSVAASRESVVETIEGAAELLAGYDPDFVMIEEVDLDSTRSYHVDQYAMLDEWFGNYYSDFAVNYDSAFLFYPPWEPHGKSLAGIAFYSRYPITEAVRRSLPISDSFSKFLDLDRCFSVSRIPVENGKELVIIAQHMSAYGNSDAIREGQISMLTEQMREEYEKGNYVICGGDFNHDLKAVEEDDGERESWAYPFPRESLPEGFSFGIDLLDEKEREGLHDSARNADMPYVEGVTYTVTLDGFILSDNITMTEYENVDTGYSYADHDPVRMCFMLK